jgi:hypothetical protein
MKLLQLEILHCGCKWIWLTVAGSSGLLWKTAQGRIPQQSTPCEDYVSSLMMALLRRNM